jgi:hypothetical protein
MLGVGRVRLSTGGYANDIDSLSAVGFSLPLGTADAPRWRKPATPASTETLQRTNSPIIVYLNLHLQLKLFLLKL